MPLVVSYKQDCPKEKRIDTVDLANIYRSFRAQFAMYRAKNPRKDVVVERTHILDLIAAKDTPANLGLSPSCITSHEARICDRLGFHPHPNVNQYLGVQVSDKLDFDHEGTEIQVPLVETSVTDLVFRKYDCTFGELVIRRRNFDVTLWLTSVSAAIHHLHRMTLVHGNLNPHGILVKRGSKGDQFVLADFSSAHSTG